MSFLEIFHWQISCMIRVSAGRIVGLGGPIKLLRTLVLARMRSTEACSCQGRGMIIAYQTHVNNRYAGGVERGLR